MVLIHRGFWWFEENVLQDLCLLGNNEWTGVVLKFEMLVLGCSSGRSHVTTHPAAISQLSQIFHFYLLLAYMNYRTKFSQCNKAKKNKTFSLT